MHLHPSKNRKHITVLLIIKLQNHVISPEYRFGFYKVLFILSIFSFTSFIFSSTSRRFFLLKKPRSIACSSSSFLRLFLRSISSLIEAIFFKHNCILPLSSSYAAKESGQLVTDCLETGSETRLDNIR